MKLLNAHSVRFIVVGAHAVAAAGRPRLTADLDVWVEPTLSNSERVVRALNAFGFGGLEPERLTRRDTVVFLGRAPYRIDVLTDIDGVTFSTAWKGAKRGDLGGQRVRFLGLPQLLVNKRAAGRPKDLLDIALLEEANPRARTRRKKASVRRRGPAKRRSRLR